MSSPTTTYNTAGVGNNSGSVSKKWSSGAIALAVVLGILLAGAIVAIAVLATNQGNGNSANIVIKERENVFIDLDNGGGNKPVPRQQPVRQAVHGSGGGAGGLGGSGLSGNTPLQQRRGTNTAPHSVPASGPAPTLGGTGFIPTIVQQVPGGAIPPNNAAATNDLNNAINRARATQDNSQTRATTPYTPSSVQVAMTSAGAAAAIGQADQTGLLPPLIQQTTGGTMAHSMKTNMKVAALQTAFDDGDLAMYDPEGAAQLDKALSLTGLPETFRMDDVAYEARKNAEILRTLELTGAADPSLEQVLASGTPFLATQSLLKRAVDAQGAIDRMGIIATPQRFLYSNPGYRQATPAPTMSPVVTEGTITPGQEYYLMQTGCFGGNCVQSGLYGAAEPY
jgi:hypothetical protein